MLTSFFSKSRPINFTFVAIYMLAFYLIARTGFFDFSSFGAVMKEIWVLLLFIMCMVVLNFIAKRNELTQRNAYKTLLFAAFSCMLFEVLRNNDVIIANFFVLLAMRRVISLRSQRVTTKKIFDASLWIFIASLFYFWSVLFLILVFAGIFLHVRQNIKYWLVPFLAFLTVLSITSCFHLYFTDSFYGFDEWFQASNFDFTAYGNLHILVPVSLLLALMVWCSFNYLSILQRASANIRASHTLIFWALVISLAVAVLAPTKNSSELFFLLAPLSVIATNYLQNLDDKWFKEMLLFIIPALPLMVWLIF